MSDTNNRSNKYGLFLFIGIFAFLFSGYVLRGIHPPTNILYGLVIFVFLFIIGLVIVRDFSSEFMIKAFAISFGVMFLIFAGFFALSAFGHHSAKHIHADKLDTVPDDFAIVTQEELKDYPALKEAISTQRTMKVSLGEFERTSDFLDQKGSYVIKVGNEYYGISFMTA